MPITRIASLAHDSRPRQAGVKRAEFDWRNTQAIADVLTTWATDLITDMSGVSPDEARPGIVKNLALNLVDDVSDEIGDVLDKYVGRIMSMYKDPALQ